ncbi:MAG: DUF222 domain-containing protein, partial [Pseudonocardiaceae bacterium]
MSVRQLIAQDLASIAPGPELARVLAGVELSRLSGFDCVEVLKAQYRQANHERARVLSAMVEVGMRDGGDDLSRIAPDEFSADEIRAALALTRRAAEGQFWLAHDLLTRLPAVHAAMDSGELDEPRARVLSEWTTGLSDDQAQAVCARLLPRVRKLTTGQLIEQIKKLAIAIDPDWARRRYEQAIAERKVVSYRNPDGSANLSGYNLPLDRVAAASGHIDALAKAAKRSGDLRPLDHVRADLFLGMTDGTYTGLDDAAIIELLTAIAAPHVEPPCDDHRGDDHTSGEGSPGRDSAKDNGPDDGSGSDDGDAAGAGRTLAPGTGPAPLVHLGVGMELRVRLSTLLGLDQYPAELAGWGYLHAELARELATTLGGAQWRFALTDEHGQLTHSGTTAARPTSAAARRAASRAIVELQTSTEQLHALATDPATPRDWSEVIADLTRQHGNHVPGEDRYRADAARRAPGAALRRELEMRDRYCAMIGCRAPARTADKDHTIDHADHGRTTGDNLGNACRHDHRLKH